MRASSFLLSSVPLTRLPLPACLLPALAALTLAGCATPGPTHAYLHSPSGPTVILDLPLHHWSDASAPTEPTPVPSLVQPYEQVYALAYDPFTDHLFLRLSPGNRFRVVDRPARSLKREFRLDALPFGSGDITIRTRDRHVFALHPELPALVRFTSLGRFVDTFALEAHDFPPVGLAHLGPAFDEFFLLRPGHPSVLARHDLQGRHLADIPLDTPLQPGFLSHDPRTRELYARIDAHTLGVFNHDGQLLRRLPLPDPHPESPVFMDVGMRSALRLF